LLTAFNPEYFALRFEIRFRQRSMSNFFAHLNNPVAEIIINRYAVRIGRGILTRSDIVTLNADGDHILWNNRAGQLRRVFWVMAQVD
jgi:hypothetical protein